MMGINVVRSNKEGEIILNRMCKPKPDFLIPSPSNTIHQSVMLSKSINENHIPVEHFMKKSSKHEDIKNNDARENGSMINIESNSSEIKEVYRKTKDAFHHPAHSQLLTSYATNFLPQQKDNPDNTSFSLTEKDNVLESKREKEACQAQKTHHLTRKQNVACRTRKITV